MRNPEPNQMASDKPLLLLAPLQGLTDFRFRRAFHEVFSGIDTCYSPWIRIKSDRIIKTSYTHEVNPKNNKGYPLIPQIMTNNAADFLFLADYLYDLGYEEINWNLGCPYPMVAKRGMGSGLLCDAPKVEEILTEVFTKIKPKLSMKFRLGYETYTELYHLLPHLDQFPLTEVIIHARNAKQMYKGAVNRDAFEECVGRSAHPMVYNGDIDCYGTFEKLQTRFPTIKKWMIGRGLIANPFLAQMIKNQTNQYPEDADKMFARFHQHLVTQYEEQLSGEKHLILKMMSFWEYFSWSFSDPHKVFKRIKKAKNRRAYDQAVLKNFREGFWVNNSNYN